MRAQVGGVVVDEERSSCLWSRLQEWLFSGLVAGSPSSAETAVLAARASRGEATGAVEQRQQRLLIHPAGLTAMNTLPGSSMMALTVWNTIRWHRFEDQGVGPPRSSRHQGSRASSPLPTEPKSSD